MSATLGDQRESMSNRSDFSAIGRDATTALPAAALILGGLLLLTRP
jgi:hypothetical protein